jgi:hypothetical protein
VIHYVTVELWPIERFLTSSGAHLADRIRPLRYAELLRARALPGGTWIFADVERLDPDTAARAARVRDALAARDDVRVLNHPTRSLRRFELLAALAARGQNRFAVHPAFAVPETARYPLFLRIENAHEGAASPLLGSPADLLRELARWTWRPLPFRRRRARHLIAVEWLDTADARGVYRKYSCVVVGGTVVPRHLFFAWQWHVKHPAIAEEALLEEERAFVADNPHEGAVRSLFELAHIDYGRIDYGVLDGALQVWEINTNPMLTLRQDAKGPRAPVLDAFMRRMQPALESIDGAPAAGRAPGRT